MFQYIECKKCNKTLICTTAFRNKDGWSFGDKDITIYVLCGDCAINMEDRISKLESILEKQIEVYI